MTPENFCYWLQGFFEIRDGGVIANNTSLTDKQVMEIRNHLRLVFRKETPSLQPLADIYDTQGNKIDFPFHLFWGPEVSC